MEIYWKIKKRVHEGALFISNKKIVYYYQGVVKISAHTYTHTVAEAGTAVCNSTEEVVIVHIWFNHQFFFIIVPAVLPIEVKLVVLLPVIQDHDVTILGAAIIETPVAGILVIPLVTTQLAKRSICQPLRHSVSVQTKFANVAVATCAL